MFRLIHIVIVSLFLWANTAISQSLAQWAQEFPKGDFSQAIVPLQEIEYDGNVRDSIPPIDNPKYVNVQQSDQYGDFEPVISVTIGDDARAYPLQLMLWHEIVNDVIGGKPLLITYCPLCNSGVVFSRNLNGQLLDFGNSGRLRNLDMVMYDRQTESWWQQFTGTAIIGSLAGQKMQQIPSRLESLAMFREREPAGLVLVPNNPNARPYGTTPFAGMDSRRASRRFSKWPLPEGINPMQYVVVANGKAWPLNRLKDAGTLSEAGLSFTWNAGRNSLHDRRKIAKGRDLGTVLVKDASGADVVYDVVFAFAFAAFIPDGDWMLGN
ncbi:MAG: DUF3179 domain-containing protein [Paracoccaceae bacterium]